jgi:hypothetical protein
MGSRAELLSKQPEVQQQPGLLAAPKLRGMPALSSPSLDTLATTASIGSLSTLNLKRFGHSFNSPPNPYDFLMNGARAVHAFAQPYPCKVLGKPLDVKFDIGKGLFRMVVTVGQDRPVKLPSSFSEQDKRMKQKSIDSFRTAYEQLEVDEEEEEGPATEVYTPVHYGHPRLLVQGKASTPSTNK